MPDDATVEILLEFVKKNERAVAEVNALLASTTDAIKDNTKASDWNAVSMEFRALVMAAANAKQEEFNRAVKANTVATTENAAAQVASSAASGGLWQNVQALPGLWAQVTIAILVVSAVLWPFTMLVGSSVIALTSFAVAGAGFLAIALAVSGAFAAMGAGVLFLGGGGGIGAAAALATATTQLENAKETLAEFDQAHPSPTIIQKQTREQDVENIAKAQQAYNDALARSQGPVGVLLGQLSTMRDTLAQQAQPLAALITQWAGGAIPTVTALGGQLMTWFGDRLPGVLSGLSKIVRDLSPDFQSFASYFGGVMDKIGPLLAPMAEAFARLALQGAKGLLDNLVRLADWFVKELPTLGPIVAQIFGQIGRFIQWVASNWANLTDFVENKWPTTVKNVQKDLKELQDWWDKNGKSIQTFGQNVLDAINLLNGLVGALKWVYDTLSLGAPTALLDSINAVIKALETLWGLATNSGPGQPTNRPVNAPAGHGPGNTGAGPARSQINNFLIQPSPNPQVTAFAIARALANV